MWFIKALLAWLAIIVAETLHGILRVILLTPIVGEIRGKQIGVLFGSAIIFAIACMTVRWIGVFDRSRLLAIGALWVALTVGFEVILGRAVLGLNWNDIAADLDPRNGSFMVLGLLFMIICPVLARSFCYRRDGVQ